MTDRIDGKVIDFPSADANDVETAAAEWLFRVRGGDPDNGDIVAFAFWRAESPDHDRIYREMERVWDAFGDRPRAAVAPRGRGPARLWLGLMAASVVLAIGGAATQRYLSSWQYDYHTGAGEIRTIALADGSTIAMKGDTAFDVHVGRNGPRRIDLARGEAFFAVRHDPARPFVVDAGSATIEDVGTGFAVERDGASGAVGVDYGVVAVKTAGRSDVLRQGERIGFGAAASGGKSAIDRGTIAAWRRRLYVATDKPLGEVLSDLGEYRTGAIVVASAALRARRINAVVQIDRLDQWLDTLGTVRGITVRKWGPVVIVSGGSR
jgi:transmembrane sensor